MPPTVKPPPMRLLLNVGAVEKRMFGLLPMRPSVPTTEEKLTVEPAVRTMPLAPLDVRVSAVALTPTATLDAVIVFAPSVVVTTPSVSAEFQFARPL